MSKKLFIKRQNLILNKLRAHPCSFKELQDYLKKHSIDEDEDYLISKRTFERDAKEIKQIYGVSIEYQRSENVYKIVEEADENKTERMSESFQIFNALSLSDAVSNQIIIDKRRPLGTENIHDLLYAIKNKFVSQFTHEKFWNNNNEKKRRTVNPLALKEARYRWYLIAQDHKDGWIKNFGLDRISNLEITPKKFEPPKDFNPEEKYKHAFGITADGTKPEKITLWFTQRQADFIKAFPLHTSQKVLSENEKECIIELYLSPSYDFVMELLSIGKEVKVLEPESLKIKIIEILEATLKLYK